MRVRPKSPEAGRSSRRLRLAALLGSLVGSLLLHFGLAVVLLRVSREARPKLRALVRTTTTEIEVLEEARQIRSPPPRAPAPLVAHSSATTATPAHSGGSGHRGNGGGQPLRSSVSASPSSPPAERLPAAEAYAGDVPRSLDLSLHGSLETASPGGETVHNRPGEVEPEGAQRSLVKERVSEWMREDSAARRVEKGLVDDWFASMGTSLDRALNTPAAPAMGLGGMWAIVDLSYDLGGKLQSSRVVESSGDRAFNLHVLNVVAIGLPGLPELPDGGGFGIHPDGTHSVWRITGQLSFTHDVRKMTGKDAWYTPFAAASSVLSGIPFDETTGFVGYQDLRKPYTKCAAELLKVY